MISMAKYLFVIYRLHSQSDKLMILKKVKEEIHVLVSFNYMERVGYKNGGWGGEF